MLKSVMLVFLALILALGAYIRLAPSDPARWHVAPTGEDRAMEGGLVRSIEDAPGRLERLDAIIRAEPRIHLLAGGVEEGMVTYIARSRLMGFPDYITIARQGDRLRIHSRLRFGRSDMGVNAARLERWLAALDL